MKAKKRRITLEGILKLIEDMGGELLPPGSRLDSWRAMHGYTKEFGWEDYFPSEVERAVNRLARKGWVEVKKTGEGMKVLITEGGKKQALAFKLEEFKPKEEKWDGKWRVVFFDVEEGKKRKRDNLRRYLKRLGFWQMQRSVWICPHDCEKEIKFLREVLEVPHGVKLGVLEKVENEEDLKKFFKL